MPVIASGTWPGTILEAPQGTDGFGYDPLFYVPAEGQTAAAMDPEKKNRLSHRALALSALREKLHFV